MTVVPRWARSSDSIVNSPSALDSQRMPRCGRLAGTPAQDLDPVGDYERRVEADAELADELGVALLVAGQAAEELRGAGLGNGAQVGDRLPRA